MPELSSPVFSVITPTYKRSDLLKRAIESVRSQSVTDYEHIIIDDGNDEATANLINEYSDNRLIFQQHFNPKGAAGAYNSGLKLAQGKFITFLDDDDEYLPEFFDEALKHFKNTNHETGFIWTGVSLVNDTNNGEKETLRIWPSKFRTLEEGLIAATTIGNGYGLCLRRECVEKTGMYDESLLMGQDADYLFRLVRNYKFETIPSVLVRIHRHNGHQLTDASNNLQRLQLREIILSKHSDLLEKFPSLFSIHYRHIADMSYGLGLKLKGRSVMKNVIRRNPFSMRNYFDFLAYELSGKDLFSALHIHRLKTYYQMFFSKRKQIHES